jgi:thymidine kinase
VSHEKPEQILEELKGMHSVWKVIIDEASFFPTAPFLQVISALLKRKKQVVVAGLAYDVFQKEWGPIVTLTKWERVKVVELTSRCDAPKCETPAIWSYRRREVSGRLVVAADSLYGACCDKHYDQLHVGEGT